MRGGVSATCVQGVPRWCDVSRLGDAVRDASRASRSPHDAKKFAHFCAFALVRCRNRTRSRNFFSASGQAGAHRRSCRRRVADACPQRDGGSASLQKTRKFPCFFCMRRFPCGIGSDARRHRRGGRRGVRRTRRARQRKKICAEVLTVKKTVIRFRPADVAAQASESDRHQNAKHNLDIRQEPEDGGVGVASLRETQRLPWHRTRIDIRYGCFCIRSGPQRAPAVPAGGASPRGCFNWAFSIHSSLTRSHPMATKKLRKSRPLRRRSRRLPPRSRQRRRFR